ncbi:hypothetical protein [Pelagibacterium halotolerans]|uniref:hypothetical protein n=1 Tax=Pelagibacterium halotolerans TaxID=531813 RepID=UPI00384F850D
MLASQANTRAQAALLVLIVLQLVMLGALYAQIPPHPPRTIPLFALAPFLGVSIAVAGAAMVLGGTRNGPGTLMSLLAAGLALVSFGPQKWLDPAIGEIWPAVLVAETAVIALVVETYLGRVARNAE